MNKRVLNTLVIAVFASLIGFGIIAPLLPDRAEELSPEGLTIVLIGFSLFLGQGMVVAVVGVSFSLARGITMPIMGRISDRWGRKRFIALGLFCYAALSLAYVGADSVQALIIVRLVHGVFSAMVLPNAMAYVGETSEKGKEAESMGALMASLFVGLGCGILLGGLVKDAWGFNAAFYAMACLSVIAFLVVMLFLPRSKPARDKQDLIPFREMVADDTMKGLLVFRYVNAVTLAGLIWFLPVYADKVFGASPSQISVLLAANILLGGLLQIASGKLADRGNKLYIVLAGSIIVTVAWLAAGEARSFWPLLLVVFVMGMGNALSNPAAAAIAVVKMGERKGMGSQMGVFTMVMSLGMVTGPLVIGVVHDTWGVEYVFLAGGLASLAGTLGFLPLVRRELRSGELKPL
jgi:MFS family permease